MHIIYLFFLLFILPLQAMAEQEVSLFDGSGEAVAYIALDDDLTIYLWSGEPVAYLEQDSGGDVEIYGFNGEHLGWFINEIIWDKSGNVSCASKGRINNPQFEKFKSFKKFKPFKSFKRFAKFKPIFRHSWSNFPCKYLLASGSK